MAPALSPYQAGDRATPARRDAVHRARRARAGELTVVEVPTVEADAMGALAPARAEPLSALQAAQWRRTAVVRRHALRDTGRTTWSPAPRRWLAAVGCPPPAPPLVGHDAVRAVHAQAARRQRLEPALPAPVNAWRVRPGGGALPARRGGPCPVAVTRGAARGALTRVGHPRARMPCLGLLPSA